jgi:Trk K+ transport system NAD-binding subunit
MLGTSLITRLGSTVGPTADRPTVAVVGGGSTGGALARKLSTDGVNVRFLDDSAAAIERALARDIDAHQGASTDRGDLAQIAEDPIDLAIVADHSDRRTILSAQLLRTAFDCDVVALVSDPDNLEAIEAVDVRVVSLSELLAGELSPFLDRRERQGGE